MLIRFALNFCGAFVGVALGHLLVTRPWTLQHDLLIPVLVGVFLSLFDIRRARKIGKQVAFERLILRTVAMLHPDCSKSQVRRYLETQGYADPERFYTAMGRLEEEGFIASERRRNGPDCPPEMDVYRYAYSLTEIGKDRVRVGQ